MKTVTFALLGSLAFEQLGQLAAEDVWPFAGEVAEEAEGGLIRENNWKKDVRCGAK